MKDLIFDQFPFTFSTSQFSKLRISEVFISQFSQIYEVHK